MNVEHSTPKFSLKFPLIGAATAIILITLTLIVGLPSGEQRTGFIIGVLVLIGISLSIGALGWHLLMRPMNAKTPTKPLITAQERHIVALALTLGILAISAGGIWDEIWHANYGIPFGDDFFWRPHLLIYFGFSMLIGVAGWGLWVINQRGKGTLQQRFRADPLLGFAVLTGMYATYALGADPIWHQMYGTDLAPWSLPHLVILVLLLVMGMLTVNFHRSLMPARVWRGLQAMRWRDVLIVLTLMGVCQQFMLITTVEWYLAWSESALQMVIVRPDWMLNAFIVFITGLFGILTLKSTRLFGSATLMGVLALLTRGFLDQTIGSFSDATMPFWVSLPSLIALDVVYIVSLRRTQKTPAFWMSGLGIAAGMIVIGIYVINAIFPYPPVTATNLPPMLIVSLLVSLMGTWLGETISDLGAADETQVVETAASGRRLWWVDGLMYASFVLFTTYFIATAIPPVA